MWVELITHGDPALYRLNALLSEIVQDVWTPLAPTLLLTMLVPLVALRRTLKPLSSAAEQASQIEARDDLVPFETTGLPREAAIFTSARSVSA